MAEATMPAPLAFAAWLSQNQDKLQPPVNNYCLYSGKDFVLMVVGGPNSRNDFHGMSRFVPEAGRWPKTDSTDRTKVNETEEWFYQLKGAMLLRIVENNGFRVIHIKEGEMFMLPGNTPHNPIRFANSTGLVMERVRPEESMDRLRWYCEKGGHKNPTVIREDVFHVTDLGTQLKPLMNAWMTKEELRRCPECREVADPK